MLAKMKKAALAFALIAAFGFGSTVAITPQPAEAGCLPICASHYCGLGKVAATECGVKVCRSFCAF